MKKFLGLVALLIFTSIGYSDVTIVGESKVKVYDFVELRAEGDTKDAAFVWRIDKNVRMKKFGSSIIFTGPPGEYKVSLLSIRVQNNLPIIDEAEKVITIEGYVPPPPPPPPPPPVDDELVKSFKKGYDLDQEPNKQEIKTNLAALYRQGAILVSKEEFKTWGSLDDAMSTAAKTLGITGKLRNTQIKLSEYLKPILSKKTEDPIDSDGRAKAVVAFTKVASTLELVK